MSELWVFGYGSLMWRPGFPFSEAFPALLKGAHRALCVYSIVHRGTHAEPGLVLGLDRGGACRGVAFRVTEDTEEETVAYLREREQVTDVYREAVRPVRLLDGSGRAVNALCYLVDRNHEQYAGGLSLDEQIRIIKAGKGQSRRQCRICDADLEASTGCWRHRPLPHKACRTLHRARGVVNIFSRHRRA